MFSSSSGTKSSFGCKLPMPPWNGMKSLCDLLEVVKKKGGGPGCSRVLLLRSSILYGTIGMSFALVIEYIIQT
jgi:hypothetical protein